MSGCECKTGFFALRDCQEPALQRCKSCHRQMCRRHGSPDRSKGRCLDCAARAEPASPPASRLPGSRHVPKADTENTALDDHWVYNYRHRFYSSGYLPIYAGTHHSSYYDRYDARAFENLDVERDDSERDDSKRDDFADDGGAGFGDS